MQHVIFKHRNNAISSVKEFLGFTLKKTNTVLNIPQEDLQHPVSVQIKRERVIFSLF